MNEYDNVNKYIHRMNTYSQGTAFENVMKDHSHMEPTYSWANAFENVIKDRSHMEP